MPRRATLSSQGSQDPSRGPSRGTVSGKAAPQDKTRGKAATWLPLRLKSV